MPTEDTRDGRWRLTAVESYVLRHAEHGPDGAGTLKLAVKELVVRGALRVGWAGAGQRMPWPGRRTHAVMIGGPDIESIDDPSLVPVLDVYENARQHRLASTEGDEVGAVVLKEFAKAARKAFGAGMNRYPNDHIVPLLERRGLVRVERTGLGRRQVVYTPAGRDADEELERWLADGRRPFRTWSSPDPARVAAYLHGAGAAVLLLSQIEPELAPLDRILRRTAALAPQYGGESYAAMVGPEDGGFDLTTADFAGLDGLDSAFTAIDFGMPELGSGGGGGDGGGGGG